MRLRWSSRQQQQQQQQQEKQGIGEVSREKSGKKKKSRTKEEEEEDEVYSVRANDPTELPTNGELAGVALVGGVVGCVLIGPLMGVAAGLGAAALSFTPTKAGQAARETGGALAQTGNRIAEWNETNQITERTRVNIIEGCEYVAKRLRECG